MSIVTNNTPSWIKKRIQAAGISLTNLEWNAIFDAYLEHWRTYHGLGHIWKMIEQAGRVFRTGLTRDEWQLLLLMILYHDVVVKIGREHGWNERESAAYARRDMEAMGYDETSIMYVETAILATAHHTLQGVPDHFQKLTIMLLDLDLMGLGQSAEGFAADTETIWLEFLPGRTRAEYDAGRKIWAGSYLNHDRIYHTNAFMHLEAVAHDNLSRLLGK